MSQAAGKTGPGPTATVAIEQHFPRQQRIIEDHLAHQMLPAGMRAFVHLVRPRWIRDWMIRGAERDLPGIWSGVLCRKRFIDETLEGAAGDIDAVVNLGAGLDTRLYRLSGVSGKPAFEVDQPQSIRFKQSRISRILGTIPSNVRLVPVNFEREELAAALAQSGYAAAAAPTFFIWEAVTQYLTAEAVEDTCRFLAGAARGSRLAFTYIRQDFLTGRAAYGWEKGYQMYVARQQLWRFGLDPSQVAAFMQQHGWKVLEHLGYDQLAKMYVRPTGRQLASTAVERMVYAEKL